MALALVLLAAACGGNGEAGPTTTEVPPLVDGPAADWEVSVDAGPPEPAPAATVPLLPMRVFMPAEPLAEFGLDAPRARVTFTGPRRIVLEVGDENFDGIGYYVRLVEPADDRVWLVLDDQLDPILDL